MANLNKVMLIGRLTRDPEPRTFSNGGKVTAFGFAVNNRKKNQQTGQWEDDPVFIDVKVFNRGETGKQADLAEQSLRKGHQVFLEGHLVFEQWDDKQSGQKRSKHVVVVDNFQFLERREGMEGGMQSSRPTGGYNNAAPRRQASPPPSNDYDDGGHGGSGMEAPANEPEIPF